MNLEYKQNIDHFIKYIILLRFYDVLSRYMVYMKLDSDNK